MIGQVLPDDYDACIIFSDQTDDDRKLHFHDIFTKMTITSYKRHQADRIIAGFQPENTSFFKNN